MPEIPSYIATLVKQSTARATERKVWSIGLNTTWLPFFTATNLQGATFLPAEALGCPMRLVIGKDGVVKMNTNGTPKVAVCKELKAAVRSVEDNFIAGLHQYVSDVKDVNPEGYAELVKHCEELGKPIADKENDLAMKAVAEYALHAGEVAAANTEKELVPA